MNAKQRFRLRRKLTAALLQVAMTVGEMQRKRVGVNRENLATAGTVLRLLDHLIVNGPAIDDAQPPMVPAAGLKAVEGALVRRGRETAKRRRRKGYRNRGRIVVDTVGT
jgi:hypothetical protein